MADLLGTAGKVSAMTGIKDDIAQVVLYSSGIPVYTLTVTGTSFAVSGLGQLSNTAALDFTIGAEDIGGTATSVIIQNVSSANMISIDLETPIALTTAGTATIAIGNLTADL